MSDVCHIGKRMNREVYFASIEQGEETWPGDDLIEITSWMMDRWYEVPAQYRRKVRCHWDTIDYEGVPYIRLLLSYSRPETNEEMNARVQAEREHEHQKQVKELELLEKLERKYRHNN